MTVLIWTIIFNVISVLLFSASSTAGSASASNDPVIKGDAFVYILNIGIEAGTQGSLQYRGLRNGFAVGNGQYVLTAAHCVDDFENTNHILRQPLILSPYYGDVFEAEIVAVDKQNDIAILKPAWDVHPELELATSKEFKSSRSVTIAGYPPVSKERGGDGKHCSRNIRLETVPRVHLNGRGAESISAGPVKYAGEGWSGSPFIVPETDKVAGITAVKTSATKSRKIKVFWQFEIPYSKMTVIYGPDSDAIRALFTKSGLPLEESQPPFPGVSCREEFEKILSVLDTLKPDNENQVQTAFSSVSKEMPNSYVARVVQGLILEPSGGQVSFERAVEIAPQSTFIRAAYGNKLLSQNKPKEAAAQFHLVTEREPNHIFARHGQLAALVKTDPNAAELLGTELTQRWPQNAAFWLEYSKALRANNKRAEELPIIQKAVELSDPVPYQYRRYLADSLKANKMYDQAEQAYEELLKTHECENCWLACTDLLLKMGPDKTARAQQAIAKAKSFHNDPNTLQQKYSAYETLLQEMLSDPNTTNR